MAAADRDRCRVTVCRGCCCGSSTGLPEIDHAGLLTDLMDRLEDLAIIRIVDCVLVCDAANVVVVSPTPAARRDGARPVYVSRVLDAETNLAIATWVHLGGPGRCAVPAVLRDRLIPPFKYDRSRRSTDRLLPV